MVVGTGDPDSDLMFVGEAPGFHEDRQGAPFVGQAGKVLERLLQTIGLSRPQVYIANKLAQHGDTLEAGDLVLAGSFTRPMWVHPGDTVLADFHDLGTITCRFV